MYIHVHITQAGRNLKNCSCNYHYYGEKHMFCSLGQCYVTVMFTYLLVFLSLTCLKLSHVVTLAMQRMRISLWMGMIMSSGHGLYTPVTKGMEISMHSIFSYTVMARSIRILKGISLVLVEKAIYYHYAKTIELDHYQDLGNCP